MAILKSTLWKNKYDNFDIGYKQYGGEINDALMKAIDNNDLKEIVHLLNIERNDIYDTLSLFDYVNIDYQDSDGNTALILAVTGGQYNATKLLLEAGADPNIKNNDGKSALTFAIEKGYTDIVKSLLDIDTSYKFKDPEPNWLDTYDTALMWAAKYGCLECAEILIKHDESIINLIDSKSRTALTIAAENGHYDIVKLLLENGADPDRRSHYIKKTALMFAIEKGYIYIVKLLLDNGAKPNIQYENNKTALMFAIEKAENGNKDIVKLLLEKGADRYYIDSDGNTALMYAVKKGRIDIVKLLIKEHAGLLNLTNNSGETALTIAVENRHYDIVKLLLENGANPDHMSDYSETFIQAAKEGHYNIVNLLLDYVDNLNYTDKDKMTALMWAAREGYTNIVKLLLERKADPSIIDGYNYGALTYAVEEYHPEIVELLLEKCANKCVVDSDVALMTAAENGYKDIAELLLKYHDALELTKDDYNKALCYGAFNGQAEVSKYLLDNGANPNSKNKYGTTALMFAVIKRHYNVVEMLLNHYKDKIDMNTCNIEGDSALTIAIKKGHADIVKLLLDNGAGPDNRDAYIALVRVAVENGHKYIVTLLLDRLNAE